MEEALRNASRAVYGGRRRGDEPARYLYVFKCGYRGVRFPKTLRYRETEDARRRRIGRAVNVFFYNSINEHKTGLGRRECPKMGRRGKASMTHTTRDLATRVSALFLGRCHRMYGRSVPRRRDAAQRCFLDFILSIRLVRPSAYTFSFSYLFIYFFLTSCLFAF